MTCLRRFVAEGDYAARRKTTGMLYNCMPMVYPS